MTNTVAISTELSDMDADFVYAFITRSYWGAGRTKEDMLKCMQNSLNFGVFRNQRQIGYARVVTDHVVFAYIMDLFITISERGNGYSKFLLESLLFHPLLKNVQTWNLKSSGAATLYAQYGFKPIKSTDYMMQRSYAPLPNVAESL